MAQGWEQFPHQDALLAEALSNPLPGEDLKALCRRLADGTIPRSPNAIRCRAQRLTEAGKVKFSAKEPEPHPLPDFPDRHHFPDDTDDLKAALLDMQDNLHKRNRTQEEATMRIDTALPVALVWRGDWHLGGEYTNHRLLFEHTQRIADTPGTYACELGDFGEGFIKASMKGGMQEQVIRPKTQRQLIWAEGRKLADSGSLAVLIAGQHDAWAQGEADFNPIEWLSCDLKVPFLGYGGVLKVELPGVTYVCRVRHKYRFNSSMNKLHSVLQMLRFEGFADIGALADKHEGTMLTERLQQKTIIALRPGSYKRTDDFAASRDFAPTHTDIPVTILWPEKRRMVGCFGFDEGLEYLAYLRGGKR